MLTGLEIDEVFSRTDSSGTSTFLTDALGSTLALADSTGTVQTSYTYGPFGTPSSTGASNSNTQQYTGLPSDGTGLQYNRARYYSPTLQRFISEDPLGFGGGSVNLYAYAGNDPINASDPSGLLPSGLDPGGLASAVTGRQSHGRHWVDNRLDYAPVVGSPTDPNVGPDLGPLVDALKAGIAAVADAAPAIGGAGLLLASGVLNSDVALIQVKDLKRVRNDWIDQIGGEATTSDLKAKGGRSQSDLYYDPATGNIYAIPKRNAPKEVARDDYIGNLKDYGIRWK